MVDMILSVAGKVPKSAPPDKAQEKRFKAREKKTKCKRPGKKAKRFNARLAGCEESRDGMDAEKRGGGTR
jgi:hypothetical protein